MNQPTYTETASAPGAWDAGLAPERPITRERVQDILAAACTPSLPITAAIEECGDHVREVALLRDPSATHGTPSIEDYDRLAYRLATTERWDTRTQIGLNDSPAVIVMLGLREGYDPAATVHSPDVVEQHLDERGITEYGFAPVHLFSVRYREDPYDEPGVLIAINPIYLPAVTDLAHALRQDRFVVTDYPANRTYALRRTPGKPDLYGKRHPKDPNPGDPGFCRCGLGLEAWVHTDNTRYHEIPLGPASPR